MLRFQKVDKKADLLTLAGINMIIKILNQKIFLRIMQKKKNLNLILQWRLKIK